MPGFSLSGSLLGVVATVGVLFDLQGVVAIQFASEDFSNNPCLEFIESMVGEAIAEDGMGHLLMASLVPGAVEGFSSGFSEVPALSLRLKVVRFDLFAVDDGADDGVGDNGTKLLHEVQGQAGTAIDKAVEEAEVGIEANDMESRDDLGEEEAVGKAKKGVDGVARRPAASPCEAVGPVVGEHGVEGGEVGSGGSAFEAEELVVSSGVGELGCCAVDVVCGGGEGCGLMGVFAGSSEEGSPKVMEFALDESARQEEAQILLEGFILTGTEEAITRSFGQELALIASGAGEEH